MRQSKVVRFIPSRAAAPHTPPKDHLHAVSARMISTRCFLSYSSAMPFNEIYTLLSKTLNLVVESNLGLELIIKAIRRPSVPPPITAIGHLSVSAGIDSFISDSFAARLSHRENRRVALRLSCAL